MGQRKVTHPTTTIVTQGRQKDKGKHDKSPSKSHQEPANKSLRDHTHHST